jgi:hypothetical protein
MTRRNTGRKTITPSETGSILEVETPAEEVEQTTEQGQSTVPTSNSDREETGSPTEEVAEQPTEQAQPPVMPQEEGVIESNTSDDTEEPVSVIDVTYDSKTNSSGFGWVIIDGKKFENDVVVLIDGSVIKRDKKLSRSKKAKYGHTPLTRTELLPLLRVKPDLIVIGTGQDGAMPITPKAQKILNDNISFIGPTPEALNWMQKDGRKTVALLHVTC